MIYKKYRIPYPKSGQHASWSAGPVAVGFLQAGLVIIVFKHVSCRPVSSVQKGKEIGSAKMIAGTRIAIATAKTMSAMQNCIFFINIFYLFQQSSRLEFRSAVLNWLIAILNQLIVWFAPLGIKKRAFHAPYNYYMNNDKYLWLLPYSSAFNKLQRFPLKLICWYRFGSVPFIRCTVCCKFGAASI